MWRQNSQPELHLERDLLVGGPGSGRTAGTSNGVGKRKPLIKWETDIPMVLPDSATPQEVWELGLRFFKAVLMKTMTPEIRLRILEVAAKWITIKPTEIEEKKSSQELNNLIALVKGEESG